MVWLQGFWFTGLTIVDLLRGKFDTLSAIRKGEVGGGGEIGVTVVSSKAKLPVTVSGGRSTGQWLQRRLEPKKTRVGRRILRVVPVGGCVFERHVSPFTRLAPTQILLHGTWAAA